MEFCKASQKSGTNLWTEGDLSNSQTSGELVLGNKYSRNGGFFLCLGSVMS